MPWYCSDCSVKTNEVIKEDVVLHTEEEMTKSAKIIITVVFVLMLLVMLAAIALSVIIIRMARQRLRQANAVWQNSNLMETVAAFFLASESLAMLEPSQIPRGHKSKQNDEHAYTSGKPSSFLRSTDATSGTSGAWNTFPGDRSITFAEQRTQGVSHFEGPKPIECTAAQCSTYSCIPTERCPLYPSSTTKTKPTTYGDRISPAQSGQSTVGHRGDSVQPKEAPSLQCPSPQGQTDLCLPSKVCPSRPVEAPKEFCKKNDCSGNAKRSCTEDGTIGCVLIKATGDATRRDTSTTKVDQWKEHIEEAEKGDSREGNREMDKSEESRKLGEEELRCGKGGCNLGNPKDCFCEDSSTVNRRAL